MSTNKPPRNYASPRPSGPAARKGAPPKPAPAPKAAVQPLSEAEVDQLQALLDEVPAPLEPLDVTMLDGFLCGVLLQPKQVPHFQWTKYVLDSEEGRSPPESFNSKPLIALAKRRYAELNQAIVERQWFDPLVFELDEEAEPSEVVFPWVAGFALATDLFPDLLREDAADLMEPLATLFMHLDPEDLEDADDLLEEIESLEPPTDVESAVESLVVSTLMLADITRPAKTAPSAPPARRGPPQRRRY